MKRKITYAIISLFLCVLVIAIIAVSRFSVIDLGALAIIVCVSISIGVTACLAMDKPTADLPIPDPEAKPRGRRWTKEYLERIKK